MFATELYYTLKSEPRFDLPLNEQREFGKKIESVVKRGGVLFEESCLVPRKNRAGFVYHIYQNKRDFSKSIDIEATYFAENNKIRFFSELAPYVVIPVIRVLLSDYMNVETEEEIVDPELPDWLKIENGVFDVGQDELDTVARIMTASFQATLEMHQSVLKNKGVGQFVNNEFDRSDLFQEANIQSVLKVFQSDFIQEIERCGLKIQRYNSDICNAIDLASKVQEAWKTFFKKLKRQTSGARAVVEAEAAALKLVGHYFFKICSEGGSLHVQAKTIKQEYLLFVEKLREVAVYFAAIDELIEGPPKRDLYVERLKNKGGRPPKTIGGAKVMTQAEMAVSFGKPCNEQMVANWEARAAGKKRGANPPDAVYKGERIIYSAELRLNPTPDNKNRLSALVAEFQSRHRIKGAIRCKALHMKSPETLARSSGRIDASIREQSRLKNES